MSGKVLTLNSLKKKCPKSGVRGIWGSQKEEEEEEGL
jgi:hypothetical protein